MSMFEPGSPRWTSRMLSVFRIVVGLLFMLHGTQKMFGFPPSNMPPMPFNLMSQLGLAGVLEVFGGALIVLGFLTRPVAFLLAGEMAVAYFQAHFPRSIYPTSNGGEHDWAHLLGQLGWLRQDQRIGQLVWLVGVLVYLAAIVGGYVALNASPKQQEAAEAVIT